MQFMQVGCNYTNWNIARHESIILSVSENAMATYGTASRIFYKTFACPNPTTLHPNVREFCIAASTKYFCAFNVLKQKS